MRVILEHRRSALLVRLLVLLLVPVVVFSTPTQAHAATTYGPAATATLGVYDNNMGSATGGSVVCNVTGYWQAVETVMNVKATAKCSTGYNVSSALMAFTARGAGCSNTYAALEYDGNTSQAIVFTMGQVVGSCQVTELCWHGSIANHANPFGRDEIEEECVPWTIGGPASAPYSSGCAHGEPNITVSRFWWGVYNNPDPNGPVRADNSSGKLYANLTWSVAGGQPSGTWAWYLIITGKGTTASSTLGNTSIMTGPITGTGGVVNSLEISGSLSSRPGYQIAGVGMVKLSSNPPSYNLPANSAGWANGYAGSLAAATSLTIPKPLGVNFPGYCGVYWGQKAVNFADSETADEPLGPVGTPLPSGGTGGVEAEPADQPTDPPADTSCSFSFTDPGSWASAGICALVKLIGALIDAVNGVAGAILGGLKGLFVPDPAVLQAELDGVKNAWSDSTIGNYIEPFAEANFAVPSGGCAGPAVDFSIKGKDVHWEPLNACGGAMATLASLAKLFITVFVGFFGGLACVRALGSGFGWRPGVAE